MYICIDVGGTKTIIASFSEDGNLVEKVQIPTSKSYNNFLKEVEGVVEKFNNKNFTQGVIGVPAAQIDRLQGRAITFANLPWHDINAASDLKKIFNCEILVENDAKLAGLYEASRVKDKYSRVLYLTVSTGIGFSVIDHLKIDATAGDPGGSILPLRRGDKYVPWESLASGKSLFEQHGKMAKDIDDPGIWQSFTRDLAEGLIWLIAIFQPEVVLIGGSVGTYFSKYADVLKEAIDSYSLPLINMPKLEQAEDANEAVVYGCYEYAKQMLSNG